jgi:hypothetical protein
MIALNFQNLAVECAARSASGFELGEERGEVVAGVGESANDGHLFPLFAFLERDRG